MATDSIQPTDVTAEEALVSLPRGNELDPQQAGNITRAAATKVVVVAGSVGSGKTTLLASIYESFQWGSFAGFSFAGSQTLPAFERRCFYSRVASGRESPDTPRTPYDATSHFLHLRLVPVKGDGVAQDMLFTDLSGEAFKLARDSTEECQKLAALKRADHVVLMVDGEKLAKLDRREEAANDGLLLLRRCTDGEMLGRRAWVSVLYSKFDFVATADAPDDARTFIALTTERFRSRFSSTLGRLNFYEVAARPKRGSGLGFAHGVVDPFQVWVSETCQDQPVQPAPLARAWQLCEFDRYVERVGTR